MWRISFRKDRLVYAERRFRERCEVPNNQVKFELVGRRYCVRTGSLPACGQASNPAKKSTVSLEGASVRRVVQPQMTAYGSHVSRQMTGSDSDRQSRAIPATKSSLSQAEIPPNSSKVTGANPPIFAYPLMRGLAPVTFLRAPELTHERTRNPPRLLRINQVPQKQRQLRHVSDHHQARQDHQHKRNQVTNDSVE
jgi:hypothetical protein